MTKIKGSLTNMRFQKKNPNNFFKRNEQVFGKN